MAAITLGRATLTLICAIALIAASVLTGAMPAQATTSAVSAAEKNAKAHSPSTAHAAAVTCNNFWNGYDSAGAVFNRSDAAVRTGASTSCTAVGRIYNQYTVWYDCFTEGQNPGTGWSTWTHLHYWLNNAWHNGWVNDGLLPYQNGTQGSTWDCLQ
ncbi:hypothetical protein AB0F15_22735 [Amycolatopsis sp. NPDC026612]|uniref:hypothetical protein n=1 Tax=Amycolatopsis sp. NPDC026612 TaxID=3155466 RepID=UPI0033F9373C